VLEVVEVVCAVAEGVGGAVLHVVLEEGKRNYCIVFKLKILLK
jgi:hypothetical protein